MTFVLQYPNVLNHPENFIKADPLVTPLHIVPE
jgi:ubiquinol-cytochrome c reductase cytochrome b subunit